MSKFVIIVFVYNLSEISRFNRRDRNLSGAMVTMHGTFFFYSDLTVSLTIARIAVSDVGLHAGMTPGEIAAPSECELNQFHP